MTAFTVLENGQKLRGHAAYIECHAIFGNDTCYEVRNLIEFIEISSTVLLHFSVLYIFSIHALFAFQFLNII